MKLLAATNNKGKLVELRELLSPYFSEISGPKDIGLSLDVDEDADTFLGNALKKATEFCKASGMPSVADDSGLCVDALDGAPGVYSARYMGDGHTDNERTMFLLDNIKKSGKAERSARFKCAVALVFPDGRKLTAEGVCEGSIISAPKGECGFGYDPVFVPEGFDRTFAEMTDDEKNAISHRGRALRSLMQKLGESGYVK